MLCFASTNLAIRTYDLHSPNLSVLDLRNIYFRMAIWEMKRWCVVPLCLLCVGYWVLAVPSKQPIIVCSLLGSYYSRYIHFWDDGYSGKWLHPHTFGQTTRCGHISLPRRDGFHCHVAGCLEARHSVEILSPFQVDEVYL